MTKLVTEQKPGSQKKRTSLEILGHDEMYILEQDEYNMLQSIHG
jgi:hypothetical protein